MTSAKPRWRRPSALVPLTVLAVALTACAPGSGGGDEGANSGGNKKITVGVEAGSPWESFYKEHAPEFTKETGVDVQILAVPHDSMRQQFLSDAVSATALTTSTPSTSPGCPSSRRRATWSTSATGS